jgi:Fur family ferric uptake transcriptional regulator
MPHGEATPDSRPGAFARRALEADAGRQDRRANATVIPAAGAAVDEVARRLTERGLRLTPQRKAVLGALIQSRQCLSAAQVHEAARRASPDLGLMTVYRTLDILAGMGVVRRVHGSDRCEAFVSALEHHGHAVGCTSCGRASEFTQCHLDAVVAAAASETGFTIADHFLQFSGVCGDCRAAAARGAERRKGAAP